MTPLDDIKAGLAALAQTLVGLALMALGIGLLVWEKLHAAHDSHDSHMAWWVGLALLGAAIVPSVGPVLTKSLRGIVGALVSGLPLVTRGQMTPPMQKRPRKEEE